MLDWMVDIGFEGTELGPPGFLGECRRTCTSASPRAGSSSSGRSCPSTSAAPRRPMQTVPGCATSLELDHATGAPEGSQPFAILSDQFDEPDRLRLLGPDRGPPRDLAVGRAIRDAHRQPPSRRGDVPARRGSSPSSIRTPARTSRRPTRSPGSWTGSTRRSWACASTPATSGSAAPIPPTAVVDYRRPHPARPHQGLQDVGHRRARARGQGPREALKRGVFCPLGEGDSGIDAVIEALSRTGLPRLAGHRAGPGPGHPRHARLGHRRCSGRTYEYLRRLGI